MRASIWQVLVCCFAHPGQLQFWSEAPPDAKDRLLHEIIPRPTLRHGTCTGLSRITLQVFLNLHGTMERALDHQNAVGDLARYQSKCPETSKHSDLVPS